MTKLNEDEWHLEFFSTLDISDELQFELYTAGVFAANVGGIIQRINSGTYTAMDAKEFVRVVNLCDGFSCQEYRKKLFEHLQEY